CSALVATLGDQPGNFHHSGRHKAFRRFIDEEYLGGAKHNTSKRKKFALATAEGPRHLVTPLLESDKTIIDGCELGWLQTQGIERNEQIFFHGQIRADFALL